MSQVKQAVVPCLAIFVLSSTVSAAAAEVELKRPFLDWEYAERVWKTLPTGEAFDREYERVNPAYEAWKNPGDQPNWEALAAYRGEDAGLVRQGYDLNVAYQVWQEIYGIWLRARGVHVPAERWNQTSSEYCGLIEALNVITGQCNDLPDWRTDEDVARDDKKMADYLAKQAKKAATN